MYVYKIDVDADRIADLELVSESVELNASVGLSLVSFVYGKQEYELIPDAQSEPEYELDDKYQFTVYLGFKEPLDLNKISEDNCWVNRKSV